MAASSSPISKGFLGDAGVISTTLVAVPLALITYFVVSTYVAYRKLSHFKGPWFAAISPLWLWYHTLRSDIYLAVKDGIAEYGSPLRIGPNTLVTDDPDLYRIMTAPRTPWRRGHWFKGMKLDPREDNVLSMQDEKLHTELRAKLAPGYTAKEVPTVESDIDEQVIELIHLVRREYVSKNEKFDFAVLAGYFTLDSLTSIAFGKPTGFLKTNKDVYAYHETTKNYFPIMELGTNSEAIFNILNSSIMQALAAPKPEDKTGLGALLGEAHRGVAKEFGPSPDDRATMLGSFKRHGVTKLQCESESVIVILAGSDSTATAMRTTFLHLLANPMAYSKLVSEVAHAVSSGNVSSPIKNSEAQDLPYLQACIREGLRMFTPLNGLGCRVPTSSDGYRFNDIFIPPNTDVGVALHTMNRRKDIFGPDADTFRPDRWFEYDAATVTKNERVVDLTFSYGKTSCLGKEIAWMELRKVFFEMLRNFDVCIVNPLAGVKSASNGVVVQEGMFMRAWPRKAGNCPCA